MHYHIYAYGQVDTSEYVAGLNTVFQREKISCFGVRNPKVTPMLTNMFMAI
jgi:hypothetical protein